MAVRPRTDRSLDRLFRLPPAEFVAARDALAAKARARGESGRAEAIRALSRPTLPAWVVNRLHWDHRPALGRLLDVGRRLRKLQESGREGPGTLRRVTERRGRAIAELLGHAERILAGAGHPGTKAMLRRIELTLHALASGVPSGGGPGRLVQELEPGGFESLTLAAPSRRGRRKATRPPAPRREDPGPRRAVRRAEADLERRTRELERGEGLLSAATERATAAATGLEDAQRRLRTASREAERARRAVDRARSEVRKARERRERASTALERARKRASASNSRLP